MLIQRGFICYFACWLMCTVYEEASFNEAFAASICSFAISKLVLLTSSVDREFVYSTLSYLPSTASKNKYIYIFKNVMLSCNDYHFCVCGFSVGIVSSSMILKLEGAH